MTESVWDYPRPPRLEPCTRRVRIDFAGRTVVDTDRGVRVLETSHPPVIYVPRDEFDGVEFERLPGRTFCEFKGFAEYFDMVSGDVRAERAAWAYERPVPDFAQLADMVGVYAGSVDACYLGGERVDSQAGEFYGGWITKDITGPFKGGPGTWGW